MAAPDGARPDAAADQAAHDVLLALYPASRADLDAQLRTELAAVPDGRPEQDGIAVGAAAAKQVLDLRAADGSAAAAAPFVAGTRPGQYRPTPPKNAAPMYTSWGRVTPFLLDGPQRLRPAAELLARDEAPLEPLHQREGCMERGLGLLLRDMKRNPVVVGPMPIQLLRPDQFHQPEISREFR